MKKKGLDLSALLQIFDRTAGVFTQLFDERLLTAALTALMGYTVLFTQRKFPMRWMLFVLFGMILVLIVTFTARRPDLRRVRWNKTMTVLWFALHGCMLVSGFFYEDWLPESLALLVAYPFMFSVFSAREDDSTFSSMLKACVFAVTPFLVWSYATRPVVIGYPGYSGVFYDANGLGMCCIILSTSALLLTYVRWRQGRRRAAAVYGVIGVLAAATMLLTLSRSALAAYILVITVLAFALIVGTAKRPARAIAALLVVAVTLTGVGVYVSVLKFNEVAREDYETALYNHEHYGVPVTVPAPEERRMTMDDLTSDRYGIWVEALGNLTWNGHETAVVEEWVAKDGGARRFNSHNSFVGVAYNNGWPAGILFLCYVLVSAWRAAKYYWRNRRRTPYAITPLAFSVVFIVESLFESVYAPFSAVGCAYLLMQGVLLREDLTACGGKVEEAA